MPPVAKICIFALAATIIVAATVVAPLPRVCNTDGMSLLLTFSTNDFGSDRMFRSSGSRPTFIFPAIIAIVAGIEPCLRTSSSRAIAVL